MNADTGVILMFEQILDPVAGSLALSALFAVLPLLTLFVLLGVLKIKAWIAGLISLGVALVVAVAALRDAGRPDRCSSATEGAAFGFFPILWIVINAIWVYNLTVATGHFDVLRRSFERVSPDQRIQAIIIAFCFGALLEALAGFGTPVAITVVMLMALGFRPVQGRLGRADREHRAGRVRCAGDPDRHAGRRDLRREQGRPGLTVDTLGAMVGRQTPLLALVVPLILVFVVDGRRGLRQTWLPAVVAGLVVRRRAVRRVQLHLGAADRHHRLAGLRRARSCCCCGSGRRPSRPTSRGAVGRESVTVGGGDVARAEGQAGAAARPRLALPRYR